MWRDRLQPEVFGDRLSPEGRPERSVCLQMDTHGVNRFS